jgi:adenylate cyclase
MEIERKFVVAGLPENRRAARGAVLRQGYLVTVPIEVRVRSYDEATYAFTVKGEGTLTRVEVEVPLTRADFDALWPLTAGRRLEKVRHQVEEGLDTIEVDVYRGAHEGLVIAEIEFDNVEAAAAFEPPAWFGPEVTADRRFKNAELAVSPAAPQL